LQQKAETNVNRDANEKDKTGSAIGSANSDSNNDNDSDGGNDAVSNVGAAGQPYLTPRRFRAQDMLSYRPTQLRLDQLGNPLPNPARNQIRYLQNSIEDAVYQSFEALCASRVPDSLAPFCENLLTKYRFVSEGLRFGDRSDQICMRNALCKPNSYIFMSPHSAGN